MTAEDITWQFFTSKGFTAIQTAAIMGNLRQEHNFKTHDVPGGLGVAQWLGARRQRLMSYGNYTSLEVQLQFIVDELHSTESMAHARLLQAADLEQAVIAFQDSYERCNPSYCMPNQRMQYAQQYFERYT